MVSFTFPSSALRRVISPFFLFTLGFPFVFFIDVWVFTVFVWSIPSFFNTFFSGFGKVVCLWCKVVFNFVTLTVALLASFECCSLSRFSAYVTFLSLEAFGWFLLLFTCFRDVFEVSFFVKLVFFIIVVRSSVLFENWRRLISGLFSFSFLAGLSR